MMGRGWRKDREKLEEGGGGRGVENRWRGKERKGGGEGRR